MLCYMYCSLATAYAETMRSVKQEERSTSQFSQGCVLCSRVLLSSFFQGSLDWSPRKHKSILCNLQNEKQPKTRSSEHEE